MCDPLPKFPMISVPLLIEKIEEEVHRCVFTRKNTGKQRKQQIYFYFPAGPEFICEREKFNPLFKQRARIRLKQNVIKKKKNHLFKHIRFPAAAVCQHQRIRIAKPKAYESEIRFKYVSHDAP